MAMDEDGRIIDYFSGKEDLFKGIIRTVGDPLLRFEEDSLAHVSGRARFVGSFQFLILIRRHWRQFRPIYIVFEDCLSNGFEMKSTRFCWDVMRQKG